MKVINQVHISRIEKPQDLRIHQTTPDVVHINKIWCLLIDLSSDKFNVTNQQSYCIKVNFYFCLCQINQKEWSKETLGNLRLPNFCLSKNY